MAQAHGIACKPLGRQADRDLNIFRCSPRVVRSCWTPRDLSRNNLRMMRLLGISLALVMGAVPAAQTPGAPGGAIHGVVTTQSGSIPLGGVLVILSRGTADVGTVMSE